MSPIYHVDEMTEMERRWAEAWHDDIDPCEDAGTHGIEAHEPFDQDGAIPWATIIEGLAKHGIVVSLVEV